MKALKIASIAAAFATLGLLPAIACDYSHERSDVTASAAPAPVAEIRAATASIQPPPAMPEAVAPAPVTETAETDAVSPARPKLN